MIKPELHIELWEAFNDISFNEENHKYTDSKNTEYTSATTWIKQFEPDIDWDVIKEKKAAKEGITVEELSKQWENKRRLCYTSRHECSLSHGTNLAEKELQF